MHEMKNRGAVFVSSVVQLRGPSRFRVLACGNFQMELLRVVDQDPGAAPIVASAASLRAFPRLTLSAEISSRDFRFCTELGD